MKKLIIAAFAVACAAVAQAASINWSATKIYGPETGALAAKSSYTALMFITSNTTDVTGLTLTTLEAVVSAINEEKWTTVASLASVNKGLSADGTIAAGTGVSTAFSSGSISAFAVVLDTTTVSDLSSASHYYLVSGGVDASASFTSASGSKTLAWGSQETNSQLAIDTPGGWQSIPEPTSALMLLIGMAGLALRRKQA